MINFNKLMIANFLSLFLIMTAYANPSSLTAASYTYYPGSGGFPVVIEMHNDTTKEVYFDMNIKNSAFYSTLTKLTDASSVVNAYPYVMLPAGTKASVSINYGDDYDFVNGKCIDLRLFNIKDQFNLASGSPGTITFGAHQACIDNLKHIVPSAVTIINNGTNLTRSNLKITISPVEQILNSDYPYDRFTLTITSNETH